MKYLRITLVMVILIAISGISSFNAVADAEASISSILKIVKIEPTVLFKNEQNGLMQAVDISIENTGQAVQAQLKVNVRTHHKMSENLGIIKSGTESYRFYLPEISKTTPARFELKANNEIQDVHEMSWTPRKHWEVCLIPISHHDIGYTASIEHVMHKYRDIYRDVIQFCEETENYPDAAKFRYSIEGGWSIQDFIENSDEETLAKLGKYIKEGRIEVQALYGNMVSGILSHEEMIRIMYPSFRINKEFGGPPIQVGSIVDMPGFSWGLPTVMAGAGAKYFFAGLASYFDWNLQKYSDLVDHTFWDEENILRPHGKPDAFYWKGPDGSKILVYYQGYYGCWSPRSYEDVMSTLPGNLNDMDDRGNPFSVMRYAGYGCYDNTPTDRIVSDLAKEWNSKWAYPKLIVSTSAMFFEKLAEQVDDVRTFSGDMPDTDYPVGALSTAKETAINRRTQSELHSAEKFATMSHLLLNSNNYPSDDLRDAYENLMLYDEHCWGPYNSAGNMATWAFDEKSSYAYKASGLTEVISSGPVDMYDGNSFGSNAKDIANSIAFDEEGQHIVVFNALSFNRNDLVNMPGFALQEPFEIIDTETGQSVPHQIIEIDSPQSPVLHAARRYSTKHFNPIMGFNLAFVADNVPSMGYKTYKIVSTKEASDVSSSLVLTDNSIENRFFKITLNSETGTVESIYDKELGIELVDKDAPHQVNQMITRWVKTGKEESPQVASIRKGQNGPVYASLVVSTSGAGCPQLTQEIKLYDKIKRVDFANRVLKDQTPIMEVYFAFPFKMDNPDFRFEGPLSVIKPLRDQFPGSNSNYYSVQNWADVSDGKVGITLAPVDAYLLEFGGLNPTVVSQAHHGVDPPDFLPDFVSEMTKGHMYSFVINSNFRTNFQPAQVGDILYRYSITTHKGNWIEGRPRDFGWASRNPLVPVHVRMRSNPALPERFQSYQRGMENLPESLSFCQIDKPNVILMTLKKAEDGEGIIIRLNETEGRDTEVSISLPHTNIEKAYETNLVEVNESLMDVQEQTIKVNIKAFGVETIRIIP